MKNLLQRFVKAFFDHDLDLRVRIFNMLAFSSACFCLVVGTANIFFGTALAIVVVDYASAIFCIALVAYARRSGRAQICHIITVVVFFFLFPWLFFKMGGYYGGITMFLVFGVVFTVFMLEGKLALIFTVLELALYTGMYLCAYYYPSIVTMLPDKKAFLVSNLMDLLIVCIVLGVTMYLQTSLYRTQQKKLDEQNAVLAQVNRAKTEFLANASHEMRTPLTVVSVNIQTVAGILKHMEGTTPDPEAAELLADAQEEIMRLARMVGGMLSLSSLSEGADKGKADLTALLRGTGDMLRLLLSKRGNDLQIEAEEDLTVYGNADLLSQVAVNLIQNAHAHTENDAIRLHARRVASTITITVSDNGSGIAPELLPHVFERGVSEGGTGYGLFLCKTVVESHGGSIRIESQQGKGTTVTITLPTYEGQFGGDAQ